MHVFGIKHSVNRETLLSKLLIFDRSLNIGGNNFPRFYDTQKSWSFALSPRSQMAGYRICMMTHIIQFVLVKEAHQM